METKAVVFTKPNDVQLRPIDLGEMHDDEILTQTLFSGISIGTETENSQLLQALTAFCRASHA